jgi:tetratricopeptide (TPR) repeat protein
MSCIGRLLVAGAMGGLGEVVGPLASPAGAVASAAVAQGQPVDSLLTEARALGAMEPARALEALRAVLAVDSSNYEAHWRVAVVEVETVLFTPSGPAQDSAYLLAERHARRAVAIDSTRVDGHFALAMALGRIALTKGKRERLRYAREIYEVATRAATLDPNHDGVHHVLALWHAEAMRISGLNRFFAKNLLGGKFLGQASWAKAVEHLETAVRLDPGRVYHRLDLARVYVDRKRFTDAREQLEAISALPDRVAGDIEYRREAAALLGAIAGKEDRDPKTG